MGTFTNTKTGKTIYYNADPERSRPVVTTERKQEAQQRYNQYRTAAKNGADLLSIMRRSATAQASGRISGGFSGRQDDLPSYISRAAGTATAQSDAVLRTDPVRTQAPNAAANSAGRSAQKDFSLLELLGGTVVKGADEAVSRATSTAAWLERNTIGRLFPGAADDTPIQALNEHFQNVKQENQEAFAPNVEAGGRLAQVVDKYGTSVVSAIPSAALAVVTAGTAPAGLEAAASAASRSPGILSALQASAQNMTKNPQFWNSFFQVAGSSYDEALSLGMSEDEADLYALANGLLSSGVEIGGGLETLPSNLKDSSGALRAWIRGMMEEGREEVVQGAISRGLQNMIGSVGNPLVSATDERAVFNPRTAAEEFTGGAVVGGFLGGGQVLAGRLLNGPTAAQEGAGAFGVGAPGTQNGAQGVLGQNKPPPEGGMVNENGLHAFSEQERINLSSGKKNKVISTFSEAVSFVKNALSNRQNVDRAYLGKVPDSVARTIRQNTGLDIRGFGVMMNGNDIRHMIKNHGDILTEQARGQVAVTADDIARIPEILAAPDRVYLSDETDTKGRKTLIFEKQIGDQYISIQGVSDGKRVLQTDTLYIRKGRPRTTRDTMPGTESAVPVINAQGEPSQKPSSIDVTIPQDAEYVNSVDPLLRWMLGSRPTAAQEGAGAFGRDSGGAGAPGAQDGAHGILGQNKTAPEVGTAVKADTSLFDRSILSNLTEARRYFAEYAKSHFPKTVINAQTGKTIGISRIGIDKFLSGRINHEKYASGFHIPELVERATLISQAKNYHPETVESIPTFEYYDSPVEIDGKQYNAHIRVKNTNVGDKYYGHTVSEVTDIEIEPSARIPSSELLTGQPVNAIDGSMGAPGERANQTSLATNGSAGTQSQASVEGTRPLNPDSIIAPRAEHVNPPDGLGADATPVQSGSEGVTEGPIQVGRVTTIQSPYQGTRPVQAQKSAAPVTVDSGSVERAANRIDGARNLENSPFRRGFKATLKEAYKSIFQPVKGVEVSGVTFDGQPYTVDINSNVPGKVISDPNLTAEKLALLDILPEVVRNGEYVGSGEYVPHGSKKKDTVRYDYFETIVKISDRNYVVSFDVEAYPSVNNYRTHKLNEIELSPVEVADTSRDLAAASIGTAPVEGTRPLNPDSIIAPGAEHVNPPDGLGADATPVQSGSEGVTEGPIQVGRVTTIQSPYQGTRPVQAQKSAAPVTVDSGSVERAANRIDGARNLENSPFRRGFKATLKEAYKSIFQPVKGVEVSGVTFDGQPYTVDINSNVPGKVISDPNLTAEKLALLDILPEVVRNGEYVGSGEYIQHGSKAKHSVRYDYFETPVIINGRSYIAAFSVDVEPNVNNYRTHRLIEMDLRESPSLDTGKAPAAAEIQSGPVEGTRPLNPNFTIAPRAEHVNPPEVPDALQSGPDADMMTTTPQ